MNEFLQRLKQRKLVQWAIAYVAAAFALLQGLDVVAQQFGWPEWIRRGITLALVVGFFITLVLAWYHGERGAQRVTGMELLILALLLAIGGGFLWRYTAASREAVAGASTAAPSKGAASSSTTAAIPAKSIAVLPFENRSGNGEMEFLSDGIAEALINSLTAVRDLKVIARTSAFRFKGKAVDPQTIGRELKAATLLTGSVRQERDNLVVQVDLVETDNGTQLWGEEFQRKLPELVSIKQTIARAVTDKLRLRLTSTEQRQLVSLDSNSPEAYRLYLRGRLNLAARSAQAIQAALDQFREAVQLDPGYAAAYSGMADCYLLLEQYTGAPATDMLPLAKAAADKALRIDDSLAEAHTSLAAYYHGMWQWNAAEKEFQRAIELNPNYPTAHHWYQLTLRTLGKLDEALTEIRRAQELDPLSSIFVVNSTTIFLMKGDLDAALRDSERLIAINPNYALAHEPLGKVYIKQNKDGEAVTEFEHDVAVDRTSFSLGNLGHAYALAGRKDDAMRVLEELQQRYAERAALGQYIASVYVGLGDFDHAFSWLEKDYQARSGLLDYIIADSLFDPIRGEPRYADLLRRMGLKK